LTGAIRATTQRSPCASSWPNTQSPTDSAVPSSARLRVSRGFARATASPCASCSDSVSRWTSVTRASHNRDPVFASLASVAQEAARPASAGVSPSADNPSKSNCSMMV
jgi:hypothetical protein